MSTPSPWKYFSMEELRCSHCGEMRMKDDFMKKIVDLREVVGFPFIVTSAYRCPLHNYAVSGSGMSGPHTTGRAIDIKCRSEQALVLLCNTLMRDFTGIGVSQKGRHSNRFIHIDDLETRVEINRYRPNIWSY